jgi:quercetin dioxygenase-like cupin family protein
MARSYALSSVPAILKNDQDMKKYLDPISDNNPVSYIASDIVIPKTVATPNGANLVVVDIAPGGQSQMHRTISIDFSICVLGTIGMELDSGETVTLLPGASLPSFY